MSTTTLRSVHGRLVFRQAGPAVPLHHLTVELRAGGTWARTETALDGTFAVAVDGEAETCELRLLDVEHRFGDDGSPDLRPVLVGTRSVALPPDGALGDVAVGFWPYRNDTPVPRAAPVDGVLPQVYTRGLVHALEASFARMLPTKALLEALRVEGPNHPTAAQIQAHQPEVRSVRADRARAGTSRSDAWLGDLLLNGFHVTLPIGRSASEPHLLRVVLSWGDPGPRSDGPGFDLTDVVVTLDPTGAEVLPVAITTRVRTPAPDGRSWSADVTRTVTPGDADWEAAKRVVRCQHLLQGALDGHIVSTHFHTEAAAIAVHRNLRRSPIRAVLEPHLREIVPQGRDGDGFAWGPHGILMAQSALTPAAMAERMRRVTAGLCWETFAPPPILHPTHRYAKAAARFFELLGDYLDEVFTAHHDAIVAAWPEVHRLSDELVARSPAYDPFPTDAQSVPLRPEAPARRAVVDGVLRSTPPITAADVPGADDLARLKAWCRVVLFRATFDHTWTHDGQYDAGGDLLLATFGLRGGSFGAEDDPALLPPPTVMLDAIGTNTVGIHTRYGTLLADEERDVPPALKGRLEAARATFAALGVDVDGLRSRINL